MSSKRPVSSTQAGQNKEESNFSGEHSGSSRRELRLVLGLGAREDGSGYTLNRNSITALLHNVFLAFAAGFAGFADVGVGAERKLTDGSL